MNGIRAIALNSGRVKTRDPRTTDMQSDLLLKKQFQPLCMLDLILVVCALILKQQADLDNISPITSGQFCLVILRNLP